MNAVPAQMVPVSGRTAWPPPDGVISADGRMMGAYVHGAFANDAFRRAFLKSLETEIDTCTQFRRHPWNLQSEPRPAPSGEAP